MSEDCIPVLDKKQEVKRKAIKAIGASIITLVPQILALFALGWMAAWPVIFAALLPIWLPFLKYAFGMEEKTDELKT